MPRGNVLTVASRKGGTMKTGLVTMLGVVLATRGYRTAVIDADCKPARAWDPDEL